MQKDLLIFALIVGLVFGFPSAGWASGVVNRSLEMNLAETVAAPSSRNLSTRDGKVELANEKTAGLAESSSIEAPVRASHLGLSWSSEFGEGALGLAVRTSPDGKAWSPWIDVEIDEHMSDHDSKVFYGKLISVAEGISHVQYSLGMTRTQAGSTSPTLSSLEFSFIDAVTSNSSVPEKTISEKPAMLSRTEWGCPDGEESPNLEEVITEVSHLIVHHTATSNSSSNWPAEVRAIWSYHAVTRGWGDIGYNFLIDPLGTVYVGRAGGDNVRGAHFTCQNTGTQGIAVLGDYSNVQPSVESLDSLGGLLAWLASREDLDPLAVTYHDGTQLDLDTISGHRDGNPSPTGCSTTVCPGDTFYPMIPEVRLNVEALIAATQVPPPTIKDQLSSIVARFTGDPEAGKNCFGTFEAGGEVLANIYTEGFGCTLYRLDDTGDHRLLSEIDTSPRAGANPGFGLSPPFNGWYYFEGSDSVHGNGFWRTNGSEVEQAVSQELWLEDGIVAGRGVMNGRLYFASRNPAGEQVLYSTDGDETRIEPAFDTDGQDNPVFAGTFFNALLFSGSDPLHGNEPRVFDGMEYSLLRDIVPGAQGSNPEIFQPLDDHWLFATHEPDGGMVFFKTNGATVEKIPASGDIPTSLDDEDPTVKASGVVYLVDDLSEVLQDPPATGTGIVRLHGDSTTTYHLGNRNADTASPTVAMLGQEAFVLVENRMFRLGEKSAMELPVQLPSDWESSDYEFVGSNPYFPHAYIRESHENGDSHIWAWSEAEVGRLMAGESAVVRNADHFRHIGKHIYFYGEDELNGLALRRIPSVTSEPPPWMAATAGAWFDPETSGQGFVLHPIDNSRSVISFYGYENDGTPLWLLGTGETPVEAGRTSEITLFASSGGNFGTFSPDQVDTAPWGTLRINFETCRSASAELDGESGRQTMDMIRLAGVAGLECYAKTPPLLNTAGITGTWYDPATSGQGFVLHSTNSGRVLISFYGYKHNSERLWLLGVYEGEAVMGEDLVLEMTLATGGNFGGFEPDDITRTTWGTLSIEFDDCNKATATLDGLDGQQTMALEKLARLEGSEMSCY